MNLFYCVLIFLVVEGLSDPVSADQDQNRAPGLNETCENLSSCRCIPFAVCSEGLCTCRPGYIAKGGKCVSSIDTEGNLRKLKDKEESGCEITDSSCPSGCRLFPTALDEYCSNDGACRLINYSRCHFFEHYCECDSYYKRVGDRCLGLINEKCARDQDCFHKNAICINGTCQCPENFYETEDGCYQPADVADGECHAREGCELIPYSSCSDGRCRCDEGYGASGGKCLGLYNALCRNSTECIAPNAFCENVYHTWQTGLGRCHCHDHYYYKDDDCHEYAKRPYQLEKVYSAEACTTLYKLRNSIFLDGRCICDLDHYFENDNCNNRIPRELNVHVDSPRACEYTADGYYLDGKCVNVTTKLHGTCRRDSNCIVPFTECSFGKCNCKQKYFEQNGRCYAGLGEKCKTSEDCALIWNDCTRGYCREELIEKNGKKYASKPGASAIKSDRLYNHWFTGYSDYFDARKEGNIAWVKNFTLDKVVAYRYYYDEPGVVLYCVVEMTDGTWATGNLEFPGDGLCRGIRYKFATSNYEVAVDLGPKN